MKGGAQTQGAHLTCAYLTCAAPLCLRSLVPPLDRASPSPLPLLSPLCTYPSPRSASEPLCWVQPLPPPHSCPLHRCPPPQHPARPPPPSSSSAASSCSSLGPGTAVGAEYCAACACPPRPLPPPRFLHAGSAPRSPLLGTPCSMQPGARTEAGGAGVPEPVGEGGREKGVGRRGSGAKDRRGPSVPRVY